MKVLFWTTYDAIGAVNALMFKHITHFDKEVHYRFASASTFAKDIQKYEQDRFDTQYNKVIVVGHVYAGKRSDITTVTREWLAQKTTDDNAAALYDLTKILESRCYSDTTQDDAHKLAVTLWEVPGEEKIYSYVSLLNNGLDSPTLNNLYDTAKKKAASVIEESTVFAIGHTIGAITAETCITDIAAHLLKSYKIAMIISAATKRFYIYTKTEEISAAQKLMESLMIPYNVSSDKKYIYGTFSPTFLQFTKKLLPKE